MMRILNHILDRPSFWKDKWNIEIDSTYFARTLLNPRNRIPAAFPAKSDPVQTWSVISPMTASLDNPQPLLSG
jgi:hypothetical protein